MQQLPCWHSVWRIQIKRRPGTTGGAIITGATLRHGHPFLSAMVGTQDFVLDTDGTILGMVVTQVTMGIQHTVVAAIGHGTTPVTMTIMHLRWYRTVITMTLCLGITICIIPVIGIATVVGKQVW